MDFQKSSAIIALISVIAGGGIGFAISYASTGTILDDAEMNSREQLLSDKQTELDATILAYEGQLSVKDARISQLENSNVVLSGLIVIYNELTPTQQPEFVTSLEAEANEYVLKILPTQSPSPDYSFIAGTPYLEPRSYTSFGSSPFVTEGENNPNFVLVDFEKIMINTAQVMDLSRPATGWIGSNDSIETGIKGKTLAVRNIAEIKFVEENNLPTHVGIVFTDRICSNNGTPVNLTFQIFDAKGVSLKAMPPKYVGDDKEDGETDEDTFFGAVYLEGISKIKLTSDECRDERFNMMEFDHLQYGRLP